MSRNDSPLAFVAITAAIIAICKNKVVQPGWDPKSHRRRIRWPIHRYRFVGARTTLRGQSRVAVGEVWGSVRANLPTLNQKEHRPNMKRTFKYALSAIL